MMSSSPEKDLLSLLARAAGSGLGDGALLERFVTAHDEAAFELLVRRHGPMVLGVCRRVLGHVQDAEDAFQATFLVLARKAAKIMPREAVVGWLHGVAHRTALKARTASARWRRRACHVASEASAPQPPDWLSDLDAEVRRLLEKYRLPLVMCLLEDMGRREAAERLAIPEGTLSSRLATAKNLLAKGLRRRGVMSSATALVLTAVEPVSAALILPLCGVARSAIRGRAVQLAEGVLRSMFLNRLTKWILAAALLLVAGVGISSSRPQGEVAEQTQTAPPPAREAIDQEAQEDTIEELQKQKLQVAKDTYAYLLEVQKSGHQRIPAADFQKAARMILDTSIEILDNAKGMGSERQAVEEYYRVMTELESLVKNRVEAGAAKREDLYMIRYQRLEAEVWLRRVNLRPEFLPPKKK